MKSMHARHVYTVKTRVFGELVKIYTQMLKGVIFTLTLNVPIATKVLHPVPLYKHPLYFYCV